MNTRPKTITPMASTVIIRCFHAAGMSEPAVPNAIMSGAVPTAKAAMPTAPSAALPLAAAET